MATDWLPRDMPNHTLFVRHAMVDCVRQFFVDANMPKYRFDIDDQKTDIYIADELTFQKPPFGQKPRIIFHFGGLQPIDSSIGHLVSWDPLTSAQRSLKWMIGQSKFTCESSNGLEAGGLASLLFTMVIANYRQFLMRGFQWCKPIGIGGERVVDADATIRRTQVDVAIQHSHSFTVNVDSNNNILDGIGSEVEAVTGASALPEVGSDFSTGLNGSLITWPTYPLVKP